MQEFETRFAEGQGVGEHIVDQVNFQISFFGELKTKAAKQMGRPLVEFMEAYIIPLEAEISASSRSRQGE